MITISKYKYLVLFLSLLLLSVAGCRAHTTQEHPEHSSESAWKVESSSDMSAPEQEIVLPSKPNVAEEEKDDPMEQADKPSSSTVNPHMQTLLDMVQDIVDQREDMFVICDKETIEYAYQDYDGNGTYEMFVWVVADQGSSMYLYFISDSGTALLGAYEGGWEDYLGRIIEIGSQKFIRYGEYYGGSGGKDHLFGVKSGQPYEPNISKRGLNMHSNAYGELLVGHSTFDGSISVDGLATGHTYKLYYFYLDDGNFKEYGGIPITLDQVFALDDTLKMPEDYRNEDYTSAFYRGNGTININFTITRGNNTYLTYRYEGGHLIFAEEGSGIYRAAFHDDIAIYPNSLP